MTKREFLDIVFALAPNEANKIMDAFDEYVDSNEPHWIPVTEEPMNDLISRQAALDAIRDMQAFEDDNGQPYLYLYDVMAVFTDEEELPPIQPKRGKWHYTDGKPARIGLSFGVICDQCGTESEYCTNFCGECGADMREVTT